MANEWTNYFNTFWGGTMQATGIPKEPTMETSEAKNETDEKQEEPQTETKVKSVKIKKEATEKKTAKKPAPGRKYSHPGRPPKNKK